MTRPSQYRTALIGVAVLGISAVVLLAIARGPVDTSPNQPFGETPDYPPVRFTDVTASAGIRFHHLNGAAGKKLLPETMGGGVAVLDFDRDGRPDLFFTNCRPWPGHPNPRDYSATQALYRNNGDGTFEDVTAAAGLAVELYAMGVAVGDFDDDGFPDLFVTAVGSDRLFRNTAAGAARKFEDVTTRAGVGHPGGWPDVPADAFLRRTDPIPFPSSAAWLDFDGDARLDLFVCRYLTWSPAGDLGVQAVLPGGTRAYVPPTQFGGADSLLYRNRGDGTFEDVTVRAGVSVMEGVPAHPVGKALGVVVCDPDADGWPDVVVANDTVRNFFFHNVPAPGGGRRFEEIGLRSNVAYADGRPRGGMGIDAAEVHPGVFSVVVANFSNEPNTLLRLVRASPPMFADVALATGLAGPTRSPMKFGAFFFDYDLDGRLDLLTCNGHLEPDITTAQPGQTHPQPAQLFRNSGDYDRLFTPAAAGGDLLKPVVGRGCAYLDYDGDGDLDVVLCENNGPARLFRNDNSTGNRWVRLVLSSGETHVNHDGIGAVVELEAGGVTQRRYVTAAHGYLSQCETTATFGLGSVEVIDHVRVRWPWPAGSAQEWRDVRPGRTYRLIAGSPRPEPVPGRP